MKRPLICFSLLLIATGALFGTSPKGTEAPREDAAPTREERHRETRMLQHLLKMEDAELAKLRQTIERIERMTPEEKENLRERIGKMERMTPERIEAMRERFKAIPPETREAMCKRWFEMSPEDRREWRRKLREMSPEERADAFEKQGFLPPPGKSHKGPKPEKAEEK